MSTSIKIENLLTGMKLAVPVKNKYGQIMLAADTVIEEKHKKILKMWGITDLYIKHEQEAGGENVDDERKIADAKEALAQRLAWAPKNEIEEELYALALQITLEKIY